MTKHVIEDRVKEGTNTVGTSSLVLTGAAQGCRSFSSVMAIGDTCGYVVDNGSDWEVGIGTLTATDTLARTTVLTSSNANQIVAFPVGFKQVFITVPAARMVDGTTLATVAKSGSYADLTNKPALFSGSYADLTNKPALFDGTYAALTGKPVLATVASSGSYVDLLNKPAIPIQYTDANARAAISVSGSLGYNSTTGVISYTAPALATVATTGLYADLTNKPVLFSGSYADLTNKPILFSGSYTDLTNKPVIPVSTSQITNDSDYTTKAYVDGQVGNISAALAAILG